MSDEGTAQAGSAARADDVITLNQSLGHLAAGAFAGVFADTLTHPFDTLNTRAKAFSQPNIGIIDITKNLIRNEGVFALFRGISATLVCSVPSTAIYFGTYEFVKSHGYAINSAPKYGKNNYEGNDNFISGDTLIHLVAGASSELVASIVVVPFEVAKSRMQLPESSGHESHFDYRNTFSALRAIFRSEGLSGLYAGYKPSVALDCSFAALQFAFYEKIHAKLQHERSESTFSFRSLFDRRSDHDRFISGDYDFQLLHVNGLQTLSFREAMHFHHRHDAENNMWIDMTAGAFSGGFAGLLTNPIDVVTNRLMIQNYIFSDQVNEHLDGRRDLCYRYTSTTDCFRKIYAEEGMNGFWRGCTTRMLSIVPLAAITFTVYEQAKRWLGLKDSVALDEHFG